MDKHHRVTLLNKPSIWPMPITMVAAEGGGVSAAPSAQEGAFAHAWANNLWAETLT